MEFPSEVPNLKLGVVSILAQYNHNVSRASPVVYKVHF